MDTDSLRDQTLQDVQDQINEVAGGFCGAGLRRENVRRGEEIFLTSETVLCALNTRIWHKTSPRRTSFTTPSNFEIRRGEEKSKTPGSMRLEPCTPFSFWDHPVEL